jgi:ferrous iron transport protein B
MMTFPGLSKERIDQFDQERMRLIQEFVASAGPGIQDGETFMELHNLYDSYTRAHRKGDRQTMQQLEKSPFFPDISTAFALERGSLKNVDAAPEHLEPALKYVALRRDLAALQMHRQQAALQATVAGWIGKRLEALSRPLGFDYRTNIALVGGFAAKEVVVSTMGPAYSLGELDPDAAGSLSERLKNDPHWNPLVAFTLLIFTMLYVPCLVTVISIRRESSWGWAVFSIGFNLCVAYLIALIIRMIGLTFGLGL